MLLVKCIDDNKLYAMKTTQFTAGSLSQARAAARVLMLATLSHPVHQLLACFLAARDGSRSDAIFESGTWQLLQRPRHS